MPHILRRFPFFAEDSIAFVREEMARIKGHEILVWVSLSPRDVLEPAGLPRFPALLDTAHTHNFSIRQEHLLRWAGLRPEALALSGAVRHQGRRVPLHAAQLWIHPNLPGHRDRFAERPAHRLRIPEGIATYPEGAPFPGLPLLGLRAVVRSDLAINIDGRHHDVSLCTDNWLSRLLRKLRLPPYG
jgi:hypothetical protein